MGETRWADWIDLVTPYLVLLPAGAALLAAGTTVRQWLAFALGAILYAQGHGIHLSANSIGNVAPGDAVHLWDEVVGHVVWYGGVALVMTVLATAMRERPGPRRSPAGAASVLLALSVGLTWVTNALGGVGTTVPALLVAVALAAFGLRHRDTLAGLVAAAQLPAAVALAAVVVIRL